MYDNFILRVPELLSIFDDFDTACHEHDLSLYQLSSSFLVMNRSDDGTLSVDLRTPISE